MTSHRTSKKHDIIDFLKTTKVLGVKVQWLKDKNPKLSANFNMSHHTKLWNPEPLKTAKPENRSSWISLWTTRNEFDQYLLQVFWEIFDNNGIQNSHLDVIEHTTRNTVMYVFCEKVNQTENNISPFKKIRNKDELICGSTD